MNKRFWVEVRVSYDGVAENGKETNMKETWLVRAATFAEAEARAATVVASDSHDVDNVEVEACTKRNISAVWVSSTNDGLRKFYKVRCEGLLVNEETGKERRCKRDYLIGSPNLLEAYETFIKCMSYTEFSEYEVLGINLTPIVEILRDHE